MGRMPTNHTAIQCIDSNNVHDNFRLQLNLFYSTLKKHHLRLYLFDLPMFGAFLLLQIMYMADKSLVKQLFRNLI